MTADPVKLATTIGDQVKKKPTVYRRGPDVLPADVATNEPFAIVDDASTVSGVQLVAGDDISDTATFAVKSWVGGTGTTVAVIGASGAQAQVPKAGVVLLPTIPAGAVLTATVGKSGSFLLPACMILVDISPNPPTS